MRTGSGRIHQTSKLYDKQKRVCDFIRCYCGWWANDQYCSFRVSYCSLLLLLTQSLTDNRRNTTISTATLIIQWPSMIIINVHHRQPGNGGHLSYIYSSTHGFSNSPNFFPFYFLHGSWHRLAASHRPIPSLPTEPQHTNPDLIPSVSSSSNQGS